MVKDIFGNHGEKTEAIFRLDRGSAEFYIPTQEMPLCKILIQLVTADSEGGQPKASGLMQGECQKVTMGGKPRETDYT
jgi:hypothetical protein